MSRVALMSSEPIRARMAGIGIRYLEMARRLPALGVETLLLSPAAESEAPELPAGAAVRRAERGRLAELTRDCDAAVAQGQWANDLLLEAPELPVAIDLYDPWLVENLHYASELGLDPYRNDHASWLLQLGRGDFFLCSGEEQRLFYQGFLAALGRVNPQRAAVDPDLSSLIAEVPFGIPDRLLVYRRARRESGAFSSAVSTTGTTPGRRSRASPAPPARSGASTSFAIPTRTRRRSGCGARWRSGAASAASGKPGSWRSTGSRRTGATTCCATSTR
jgi:hypothetical protein